MRRWLQLTRLQTSGLTMAMLVITRWVAAGVDLVDTLVLAVAGLLVHAGAFSMNEWADRHHDQDHGHKVNAITDGRIRPGWALSLSLGTLTLSLVLLLSWSRPWSVSTVPLLNSYVMGTSYNLRGKRFPRLAPVILAGWAFMLSLWVCGLSGFPRQALWLPFAWGFMLWLQVLEGDLKDWVHDGRDPGGLDRHNEYMSYIQVAFIIVLLIASRGIEVDQVVVFLFLALFCTPICVTLLVAEQQTWRIRSQMLKNMGLHNIWEYGMIVATCLLWVSPWWLAVVLAIPVAIYVGVNHLAYGRPSAPLI